jgi:hypothetical protein
VAKAEAGMSGMHAINRLEIERAGIFTQTPCCINPAIKSIGCILYLMEEGIDARKLLRDFPCTA